MKVIFLNELIRKVINQIYLREDYEFFRKKCLETITLPAGFDDLLRKSSKVIRINLGNSNPSEEWHIHFGKVIKGEFSVSYRTGIKVSKIVPAFYIQHEFEVSNKDEERMGPILDGFSNEAYCKRQYELHEKINQCLVNSGYLELSYAEMSEVICDVKIPEDRRIFGSQLTVETAIFRDIYELVLDQ